MITVVGLPAWRTAEPKGPGGRACEVALAAAARGSAVELVGRTGDDAAGDALVLALGGAKVGHAALLRDPARPTPIIEPVTSDDTDGSVSLFADPGAVSVAMTSAAGPRLEPADVSLGLRYLTTFSVLVVTDDVPAAVLPVAVEAASFAGARLVVLLPASGGTPPSLPEDATVLSAPDVADDGEFGAFIGGYAAALDRGLEPAEAFRVAMGAAGWEAAQADAG